MSEKQGSVHRRCLQSEHNKDPLRKEYSLLVLDDGCLLRDVHPIEELTDVLVLHRSGLLDEGGGLAHSVDRVSCSVEHFRLQPQPVHFNSLIVLRILLT